jgi:glycosyltransferase involved in cell wall biosynthesis
MKISFNIPTYNKEIYLAECMNSLIDQTYKDIEVIVVDDCSTDSTKELMEYYTKKYDFIKYYRNDKNMGVGYTRNRARDLSCGQVICVQDADDMSTEFRAEEVNKYFTENKKVDILYGACAMLNGIGQHVGTIEAKNFSINAIKNENFIQHPSVAYRKDIPVKYRDVRYIDDWYFYMDCIREGLKFGKLDTILGIYRPSLDGLTLGKGFENKDKDKIKADIAKEYDLYEDAIGFHMLDKNSMQNDRMKAILKAIKSGSRVLDVGCNDGTLMEQLQKKNKCQVYGIEKAINLVNLCKRKGLNVIQGDIIKIQTLGSKYDYIILADILEHFILDDILKILDTFRNYLKSDGKFIITVPYKHATYSTEIIKEHKTDIDGNLLKLQDMTEKPIKIKNSAVPVWLLISGN